MSPSAYFDVLHSRFLVGLEVALIALKSPLTVTTRKKENHMGKSSARSPFCTTTATILGLPLSKAKTPIAPKKVKPEWQKYYNLLLGLRDQLLNQKNGLVKDSAQQMPGYSLHMADSGTDNFDRDFALSLLSADQDALYEIEEALKRIQKKTYGICELTGKSIPKARLEAIPWTRFTVGAQAQLERQGELRSRRLGQINAIDNAAATGVDGEEDLEEKAADKE